MSNQDYCSSLPSGLGLGSGIGLPPRAAASATSGSLRRGSIGLPAIGIGGFNVTSGPPNSPGAWVHHDARAAASVAAAASANTQGEGTAPTTAAAAGGSKSSGDKPPRFQSTFQLAQPGLGQSGLAAAMARAQDNGGSPEGLGPSPTAGGGSAGGGANGSVCAGSGAGTSTPRSVTPSAGSLCRSSGHDLQALVRPLAPLHPGSLPCAVALLFGRPGMPARRLCERRPMKVRARL